MRKGTLVRARNHLTGATFSPISFIGSITTDSILAEATHWHMGAGRPAGIIPSAVGRWSAERVGRSRVDRLLPLLISGEERGELIRHSIRCPSTR